MAFLLIVASLAPRVLPAVDQALPAPSVAALGPAAPAIVEEPAAVPAEPKEVPAPRVAIGFNPLQAKLAEPALNPPAKRADDAIAPARADAPEPEPIRLAAPRRLAMLGAKIHRPFDTSEWLGPKVIVPRDNVQPPENRAQADQRPRPQARRKAAVVLEEHTVRLHWEHDVEQYRALDKAGYKVADLRQIFGARYREVRSAAFAELTLSNLPPPPKSYIDALANDLNNSRP